MESAAVLRVKRKRGGSEPAEALVIACKRLCTEQGPAPARDSLERSLFKLVGTASSQNEPIQKYIQEAVTRDKAAQILRPSLGSTQRIIQDVRSTKQVKRQENRYRIITSHRPNCAERETIAFDPDSKEANEGDKLEAKKESLQQGSTATYSSSSCFKEFQLFDILREEEVGRHTEVTAANAQKVEDPDVILCNAVEMIRERLTVSENNKGAEHSLKEDEYVYDIYYMETFTSGWIQDILSVQPYTQEYELVDDDHVSEEIDDDEDDENSENNWRNDYPDEDEFLPEEDENSDREGTDRELEDGSFSDEDDRGIRRRTWDKYHCDILQEFGYDGVQDLDSD